MGSKSKHSIIHHQHHWQVPKRYFVMNFIVVATAVWVVLFLSGCGPNLADTLQKGFKCKAIITIPEGVRSGDVIELDVEIYDCKELEDFTKGNRVG